MSNLVIQGKWDDLVNRSDLRGRQVVVTVIDETQPDNAWLQRLREWADSHSPVSHSVDDSRDSFYTGTLDDSR